MPENQQQLISLWHSLTRAHSASMELIHRVEQPYYREELISLSQHLSRICRDLYHYIDAISADDGLFTDAENEEWSQHSEGWKAEPQ